MFQRVRPRAVVFLWTRSVSRGAGAAGGAAVSVGFCRGRVRVSTGLLSPRQLIAPMTAFLQRRFTGDTVGFV